MNFLLYIKDKAAPLIIAACACACMCVIAALCGAPRDAIIAMAVVGGAGILLAITVAFFKEYRFWKDLAQATERFENEWNVPEIIDEPTFSSGQIAYRAVRNMRDAATDSIQNAEDSSTQYREYIESWIHEVKTPIAAANLILERQPKSEDATALQRELSRINTQVEQALWYARSSKLVNDYAIRAVQLRDIATDVCRNNARFLIEQNVHPRIEVSEDCVVFSDEKWLSFIVTQIVVNAAKYGASEILFETEELSGGMMVLRIKDNGIGISEADLPRVFERGFTGAHGRSHKASTGMGLYLAKTMCGRMGLFLDIASSTDSAHAGTAVTTNTPLASVSASGETSTSAPANTTHSGTAVTIGFPRETRLRDTIL